LAVTDWRLRRWRLWFLALSNAPRIFLKKNNAFKKYTRKEELCSNYYLHHTYFGHELKLVGYYFYVRSESIVFYTFQCKPINSDIKQKVLSRKYS